MSSKYESGDELRLRIEKIVPRGLGLAFAERLTVFIPLAAAGDVVRAKLTEIKGKTAFAEITEVIEPSPDRIAPPCEYFGACGGCDMMQLNYEAQLAAKVAMVRDCIERIAKIELEVPIDIIPSPEQFGYRLRAQWHAEPGNKTIGYYRRNSRDLVDVKRCMVLVPALQAEMDRIRGGLGEADAIQKIQIDAAAGSNGDVSVYSADLLEPTRDINFASESGDRYSFSARSFFQGNRFLIDKLIETAIGDATGEIALDLYSGVGLFTLPLARRFKNVIGVEDNEHAVEFADANAVRAGLDNIDFYAESVRKYLASAEVSKADFVLLDPPRAGAEKDTIMNLIKLGPKHVSYVACEPSILARDLKRFVENGYAIKSITALDLFPQTHHVETVARLQLVEEK